MLVEGSSSPKGPNHRNKYRDPADDRDLLYRIQSPDPDEAASAHHDLFDYCLETIEPILRLNLADKADRDDVAQETCEYVLRHIPQFEFRGIPLAHWFSAIAKKKAQTRVRQNTRHSHQIARSLDLELEERLADTYPHDGQSPAAETGDQPALIHDNLVSLPHDLSAIEADRLVQSILSLLPVQERRVVMVMWFAGATNDKEIAHLLRMKPGTVRVYRHRVRERLSRVPELLRLFHDLFT